MCAALLGGGGYAEYVSVPYGMVMLMPEGLLRRQRHCRGMRNVIFEFIYEGHLKKRTDSMLQPVRADRVCCDTALRKHSERVITSVFPMKRHKELKISERM